MHKLMMNTPSSERSSTNLHIHVPQYTHFIPFMSKKDYFQVDHAIAIAIQNNTNEELKQLKWSAI